jgi:hypothetical protein
MAFDRARALAIGLERAEISQLAKLSTPGKVQSFLTSMPINREERGDTCQSVRMTLRENCCHCIEAAFVAAAAFMLHGRPALLLDIQANGDDDHVVALFRHGRHWGAISKSNSIGLRWRDPIYASPRELAMSYFHEYVFHERKTMRRISDPFDIGAYDPAYWITAEEDCWDMAHEIDAAPHTSVLTTEQARRLRQRENFEVVTGMLREFPD